MERRFVTRAEELLGVRFPPLFVAEMLRQNGGEVVALDDTWELHTFLDTSDRRRLRTARNDIVQETRSAREWPNFPPGAVPMGGNGTGDRLVLLTTDQDPAALGEAIHCWFHEGDPDELEYVADDLHELRRGRRGR